MTHKNKKMNIIYEDLLESFKGIKLQGTKPNKNWYSRLSKYQNLWNFFFFLRYVSLLFPVFSNFWVLLYYYFDLQKLELAGHIHTYIYVYVIYIYIIHIIYIIYALYIYYILYIIYMSFDFSASSKLFFICIRFVRSSVSTFCKFLEKFVFCLFDLMWSKYFSYELINSDWQECIIFNAV